MLELRSDIPYFHLVNEPLLTTRGAGVKRSDALYVQAERLKGDGTGSDSYGDQLPASFPPRLISGTPRRSCNCHIAEHNVPSSVCGQAASIQIPQRSPDSVQHQPRVRRAPMAGGGVFALSRPILATQH
jgi:hypothetical protein